MESPSGMNKSLKRLHDGGVETDVTLTVGDQQWKVHKLVLAMHSKKLHKLAQDSDTIELKDTQFIHMAALVHFLYRQDYDATEKEPHKFHVAMNKLAARYEVEDLVTLTVKKMEKLDLSYCDDDCRSFLSDAYENQGGATKDMKKTIVRLTFERDDGNWIVPGFFQKCGQIAFDMYEHIIDQMHCLRMKMWQYQEYKHCLPFRADFYKMMNEDIDRRDKVSGVWESPREYRKNKQIACPYCGTKASMEVWEMSFHNRNASY